MASTTPDGSSAGDAGATWYLIVGNVLALITGVIVFVAAWIYCIASYGFLLGVGLGWLPASIVATIASFLVRWLWGFIALAVVIGLLAMFGGAHPAGQTAYASPSDAAAAEAAAASDAVAAASAAEAATAVAAANESAIAAPQSAVTATAPPPDFTQVRQAVSAMDRLGPEGLAGAIAYDMKCYAALQANPTWRGWDDCAAFDQYGFERFGQAGWRADPQYFDGPSVTARQLRAIAALSTDTASNNDRIAAIRGLVDQAVVAAQADAQAQGPATQDNSARPPGQNFD